MYERERENQPVWIYEALSDLYKCAYAYVCMRERDREREREW